MEKLKCIIVDDEPLARVQLRTQLEQLSNVSIIAEAGHRKDAVEVIRKLEPNLIFLDVKMRGGGGFEILNALENPPPAVFITAHDDYAIRAFEVDALDYLLKPVEPERLRTTVKRVIRRIDSTTSPVSSEKHPAFLQLGSSGKSVAIRDILYIRSSGHYSEVNLGNSKKHLVRQPFNHWASCLPQNIFPQLSRSLIVNLTRITSCSYNSRSVDITFQASGERLTAGGAAARRLRELL